MSFREVKKNFIETETFLKAVMASGASDATHCVIANCFLYQQFETFGTLDSIDITLKRIADSLEKIHGDVQKVTDERK